MDDEYTNIDYSFGVEYLLHFVEYISRQDCKERHQFSLYILIVRMLDDFNLWIDRDQSAIDAVVASTKVMLAAYSSRAVQAGRDYAGNQMWESIGDEFMYLLSKQAIDSENLDNSDLEDDGQ